MDQTTGTIENLFKECGYSFQDLNINTSVDVSETGIEILSYNHKDQTVEFKQVLSLIRKNDTQYIEVYDRHSKQLLLRGTENHLLFDPINDMYLPLAKANYALDVNGNVIQVYTERTHNYGPVLDLEIADNACYFSNGLLSHNTTPGGNALKFYASQRVDVRRKGGVKEGDELVANETRVKIVKNKVAKPFKEAEFVIRYGQGIDYLDDVMNLSLKRGVVEMKGAGHYRYQGEPLCHGKPNLLKKLEEDEAFRNEIIQQVI